MLLVWTIFMEYNVIPCRANIVDDFLVKEDISIMDNPAILQSMFAMVQEDSRHNVSIVPGHSEH